MNKSLDKFIYHPAVSDQFCICLKTKIDDAEFRRLIEEFEETSGLKMMARGSEAPEELNGFITMSVQSPPICLWGEHPSSNEHTSIIVSLYGRNAQPEDSIHSLVKTELTGEIKQALENMEDF